MKVKSYRQGARERFYGMVDDHDECWLWCGPLTPGGYGRFWFDGKGERAHRAIWMIEHGPLAEGEQVHHSCDNPRCVRLSHLWTGSQADNMADMAVKRRRAVGARHGTHTHPESRRCGVNHWNTRLTEDKVREMRRLYADGMGTPTLGREFGISTQTAWRIVKRVNWKHVE